jgi:hypothetical protein
LRSYPLGKCCVCALESDGITLEADESTTVSQQVRTITL